MRDSVDRMIRILATVISALALLAAGALLLWDFLPWMFPPKTRNLLASLPLASIAMAYVAYQATRRIPPMEMAKAAMLACAFLFWAANQLWPDWPQATLCNDIAIVLFVLDVFLVIVGWPPTSPDESFAEAVETSDDGPASGP